MNAIALKNRKTAKVREVGKQLSESRRDIHTEKGRAIKEGLEDVKNGKYITVDRDNLEEGIKKLFR